MKKVFAIMLFGLISLTSCAQQNENTISNEEFVKKISDSSVVVLDVRTPAELQGPLGKIDGVINIPVQELNQRINELQPYKDKEIMVICRTANRSTYATEVLIKNGYDAKNVLGGMVEYRKNN